MGATSTGNTPAILVSDFDGTITKYDFYDLVCREYPEVLEGKHWQHYEEGRITHFEALRRIFAAIRVPEEQLLAIVNRMEIDPSFNAAVARLRSCGWRVVIASAGCRWYVGRLLADAGVDLEVHANPGFFSADKGLVLSVPRESPYYCADLGINKAAVVRAALHHVETVAFAGDGRPDLAPALLVPAERRFAKSWLARKLREIGEGFRPFETWSQIVEALVQECGRC